MAMTMVRHGRLLLGVHHAAPPTDEEWGRWLALAAERSGKDLRALIEVYGSGAPNARQRNAMTPLMPKLDPRSAVLTESRLVRGVVTAVSWLGIPISAFGSGQHEAAGRYLGLTSDELRLAKEELERLRREAGVGAPSTQASSTPSKRPSGNDRAAR